jgi:L-rhamnose isomerase
MPSSKQISAAYRLARSRYAELGADTEVALRAADLKQTIYQPRA